MNRFLYKSYLLLTEHETITARHVTDAHALRFSWRMASCYYPVWVHWYSALVHYTLLEMLIFSVCVSSVQKPVARNSNSTSVSPTVSVSLWGTWKADQPRPIRESFRDLWIVEKLWVVQINFIFQGSGYCYCYAPSIVTCH